MAVLDYIDCCCSFVQSDKRKNPTWHLVYSPFSCFTELHYHYGQIVRTVAQVTQQTNHLLKKTCATSTLVETFTSSVNWTVNLNQV